MKSKCTSFGLWTLPIVSRFLRIVAVLLVVVAGGATLGVHGRADAAEAVEVEEFALFFEFNSTDGDLGLQGFVDADAWRSVTIKDPNGRKILEVTSQGSSKKLGLTEFDFESQEPLLAEEDVRDRFPEGVYTLVGRTVDGEKLTGEAVLSHDLPAAPINLEPADQVVDPNGPISIAWNPGIGGEPVRFWVVEVETGEVQVLSAVLDVATTVLTIPAQLIKPGTEYEYEVIAVGENGNRTITEVSFMTAP